MECTNFKQNMAVCNCTYDPCPRKGKCCECVAYHKSMNQLPACYFSSSAERSYDRSYRKFFQDQGMV